MNFPRWGAQARGFRAAGCLLAFGVSACTSSPAPTAQSSPSSTSTSPTQPSEEAEKAAILKAYKNYDKIQEKLRAAKPISAAEINSVSTDPWRAELTKIAKVDPKDYVISTGPVKEKVMSITVDGATATVMACRDTTKTTVLSMPTKFPLNAPTEPLYFRLTYTKASGTWLRSAVDTQDVSCEVGE